MNPCERCGAKPPLDTGDGYGLWDYCAECMRTLCVSCMAEGCCGIKPATSGEAEDCAEDEEAPDAR